MKDKIKETVERLERIAETNKEKFRYSFLIHLSRKSGGEVETKYSFSCTETEEGHLLLSGWGSTPEEAAENAGKNITDSVKEWGFNDVL